LSTEINSHSKRYNFDYKAIITRALIIHHGSIPTFKSYEVIKDAKNLKELFLEKLFVSRFSEKYIVSLLKSLVNFLIFRICLRKFHQNRLTFIVHHEKFIKYINESGIFDDKKLNWILLDNIKLPQKNSLKDNYLRFRNVYFSLPRKCFILNYCEKSYESFLFFLKRVRPSTVFVLEGDAPYHIQISNACNTLGIKNFCFQWGLIQTTAAKTRFSNMNFTGFLTWGNFFTDQLVPYNSMQNFHDFGHLNFSITKSSGHSIIFLDQGSSNPQIDQSHFQEYHKIILRFCQNTHHKIIVRPHPNHDLCEVLRENLIQHGVEISNNKTSLSHDLSLSKVAVSIMSSSLLDASINGIIPVSFRYDQMEEYPFPLNQLKIGLESSCPSEIFKFINLIMSRPSLYKEYKERLLKSIKTLFSYNTLSQRKCSLSELLN
jgi:hypothetical protein